MKISKLFFFTSIFSFLTWQSAYTDSYDATFLFQHQEVIDYSMFVQFLPYNPTIVEAGAFRGDETIKAAKVWPHGQIFAFEPNPDAFSILKNTVKDNNLKNVELFPFALNTYTGIAKLHVCHGLSGVETSFGYASSLLPAEKNMAIYCNGPKINVQCVRLDDWCKTQGINHIDILRLELEGFEAQIMESSRNVLKNVKIIYVKTYTHPHRSRMAEFDDLKELLEDEDFVLLVHRYEAGIIGHAIFLSRELFDAYFKKSLGIYLEV